jgi:beta-glucosidase
MRLRRVASEFLTILLVASVLPRAASAQARTIDQRIDDLLSRMTLDEKVGQLVQFSGFTSDSAQAVSQGRVGSLLNVIGAENTNRIQRIAVEQSRLGIPLLFGLDVIHGYRTTFPIPLATAASWDPELVTSIEAIAAREARASGVHWTFAPMIDIARDPRWGRIIEGAGEDPYLGAAMAAARVRGFQGDDLAAPDRILACLKHYVAYGAAVAGRDYNSADMSEHTLRQIYLPPYRAGVEAGAGSLMSAFNLLNGVPASADTFTINHILRGEWGFDGFIVSDWNSIGELIPHGYAADGRDAARLAFGATVDMDMMGGIYAAYLADLVRTKVTPEAALDAAVRRVLRAKFTLGLFDHPYTDPTIEKTVILRAAQERRWASAPLGERAVHRGDRSTGGRPARSPGRLVRAGAPGRRGDRARGYPAPCRRQRDRYPCNRLDRHWDGAQWIRRSGGRRSPC